MDQIYFNAVEILAVVAALFLLQTSANLVAALFVSLVQRSKPVPAPPQSQESAAQSGDTDTHRTLWAHTRTKVPQFACCPDLLRLIVEEGGEGSGPRPLLKDR